ncbi:GntR family transcriptional regulator [bacterium]|nr:GntR family transcriptional regulator [bacterium]
MMELKQEQRKININELPRELPDFSASFEPKDSIIKKWITNWILSSISKRTIKDNDILPAKTEISKYLGVSVGTVQNAIRYVEDSGLLKSKQKLGTMISASTNPLDVLPKSTSKRDKAVLAVKKYIIQKDLSINKPVPSTRKMSEMLNISQNTIRLAYDLMCTQGYFSSRQVRGNDSNWILIKYPKLTTEEMTKTSFGKADTLVEKITAELKSYLAENFKIGDKIPSHDELAATLNVSVKTIHDCVKNLNRAGILLSRRGRYGTILASNPLNSENEQLKENFIFSSAFDASFYSYQKIENKLLDLISNEFKAGDKLPSMKDLSEKFDVSTNTIRKALNSIAEQGYITFGRGRYGGTFIVDIPEVEETQSYQWLAINPDYM